MANIIPQKRVLPLPSQGITMPFPTNPDQDLIAGMPIVEKYPPGFNSAMNLGLQDRTVREPTEAEIRFARTVSRYLGRKIDPKIYINDDGTSRLPKATETSVRMLKEQVRMHTRQANPDNAEIYSHAIENFYNATDVSSEKKSGSSADRVHASAIDNKTVVRSLGNVTVGGFPDLRYDPKGINGNKEGRLPDVNNSAKTIDALNDYTWNSGRGPTLTATDLARIEMGLDTRDMSTGTRLGDDQEYQRGHQEIAVVDTSDVIQSSSMISLGDNMKMGMVGSYNTLPDTEDAIYRRTAGPSTGQFIRPVPGRITSSFGMRNHPTQHVYKMHTGVDLACGTGTPVLAADSGMVTWSGWKRGYGNTVIIMHKKGITTLYGHGQRTVAIRGISVSQGDIIMYSGSTGISSGPHLHFEIRVNGHPVDPAQYLVR